MLNLIKLVQNGNSVDFEGKRYYFYNKKRKLVAVADVTNCVYRLNMEYKHNLFTSSSSANNEMRHKMKKGAVTGVITKIRLILTKILVLCARKKQSEVTIQQCRHKVQRVDHWK